jgi:C_GCAxxG_C_C family probable redox protein
MDKKSVVDRVVDRVGNCYQQHDLCCSESIMVVLNGTFGGGLSGQMALQMGAGFCHGFGGAGCSCGALAGGVTILSLFLGPHDEMGLEKKVFQQLVKGLHDDFRQKFGSTCCRVLTKKVRDNKERHQENCLMLTKGGAELVVGQLLSHRPELLLEIDNDFLSSRTAPF